MKPFVQPLDLIPPEEHLVSAFITYPRWVNFDRRSGVIGRQYVEDRRRVELPRGTYLVTLSTNVDADRFVVRRLIEGGLWWWKEVPEKALERAMHAAPQALQIRANRGEWEVLFGLYLKRSGLWPAVTAASAHPASNPLRLNQPLNASSSTTAAL